MAERIHITPEVTPAERDAENHHDKQEHAATTVETVKEKNERLEHIRGQIQHEAKDKSEISDFDNKKEKVETETRAPVNKELRNISLRKELKHVRSNLNPLDKLGSKVIHNPIVRNISEVSAKSITRPSGLLGGGLVAFLGTGAYYYLTEHVGLKYNYLIFALLFVGGFVIGLIIELGVYTLRSAKRSAK